MTTYIYDTLDHRKAQTRLVTIPPLGDFDESAPLHISLHTVTIPRRYLKTSLESAFEEVDLNLEDTDIEKPDFVALSYVWGSPDDPSEVFVDSAPEGANKISITRNLDVALRHMRSKIEQPVVFWIDAICIDQGNLQERGYQVAFMDTIYTIAEGTSIWLGLEENNSDLAMDILLYVGERVSEKADGTFERAPDAPPQELNDYLWEEPDEPAPLGKDAVEALVSFLERPWFKRLWVRQEIALADQAQVQCGTRILEWDYFRVAALCFLHKPLTRMLSHGLRLRHAEVRASIRSICAAGPLTYRYEKLRWRLQGVCCTDPRDMIYGVRSLLMSQDQSLGVQPNYTLEAADVFMDVCVRIVEKESRAYFLQDCEVSSISVPNLPSWVPDWSTSVTARTLLNSWSACGFISANATYLGDKILRASGVQIDEISSIRALYNQADDGILINRATFIRYIRNCFPGKDLIHSPYDQKQSMMDAYCRTFARDDFLESYHAVGSIATNQTEAMRRPSFDEVKEALQKIWFMDEELILEETLVDDSLIDLFIRSCLGCLDRCFFVTKDGYIGLAPQDIKLGDVVSVILGCQLPLILRKQPSSTSRPDGTRWQIVGPCYIHGLMSGEAIYGSLPSHYRAVVYKGAAIDELICGLGYALLDTRTDELKTDPAAILEEFGIKPSVWTREPHRLEVSESVMRDAGVNLRDFLLV